MEQSGAKEVLPEIRSLIAEGRYEEADQLCRKMLGPYTQSYLPLGDLNITMEHGQSAERGSYSRKLELSSGMVSTQYTIGGVRYTREVFVSYPDQVIAVRMTASREGTLSFRARLDSPLRHKFRLEQGHLTIYGHAPEHVDPNYYASAEPIRYGSRRPPGAAVSGKAGGKPYRRKPARRSGGAAYHGCNLGHPVFQCSDKL